MSKEKVNRTPNSDWIKTLYEQTWNLITHEDNLQQSRNQGFLTILSIFLTANTAIVSYFLANFKLTEISIVHHTLYIIGLLILLFIFVSFIILRNWEGLTNASQSFVKLRRSIARDIESKYYPDEVGIAQRDHDSFEKREKDYFGGYESTIKLIHVIRYICVVYALIMLFFIVHPIYNRHFTPRPVPKTTLTKQPVVLDVYPERK